MTPSTTGIRTEATISRVFDATPEQLWACLTQPEHFARWFGGPPFSLPVERITMDVRPGGVFSATMVSDDDGTEVPFRGEFLEVEPLRTLSQTLEDPFDPANANVEILTTTLEDVGGGRTRATYHQVGHLPPDEYAKIEAGVGGFYDRLADYISTW